MRLIAPLDQLPHRCDPGGPQQLLELGEVVVLAGRDCGHHQSALASAPGRTLALLARPAVSVR